MPPALKEAKGDVKIEYTNPIGLAMQGPAIAGYVRTMEFAGEAVKVGADPSIMDIFELDEALPAIGDMNMAPVEWFASPKSLAAKRKQRAQAQQRDQESKELPGKAAIMKAQAIAAKAQAGQNIGGTLSGTPDGGMPQMPEQG
jgi:hypothetical protein